MRHLVKAKAAEDSLSFFQLVSTRKGVGELEQGCILQRLEHRQVVKEQVALRDIGDGTTVALRQRVAV